MRSLVRNNKKWIIVVILITCVIGCGVDELPKPVQPDSANAGERIQIVLKPTLYYNHLAATSGLKNLLIGILVPKSWKAFDGNNTTIAYTSDIGNGNFVKFDPAIKVPNNELLQNNPKGLNYSEYIKEIWGAGKNATDDHEWIMFISDKQYEINRGQTVIPTITVSMKVGTENMLTKFAYYAGIEGTAPDPAQAEMKVYLSDDCFEVKNGTGDRIDLCNPKLSIATPLAASDRDFITIDYDNDLTTNDLSNISSLYVCATAHLTDGTLIERCNDYKEELKLVDIGRKKYRIIISPYAVFDLDNTKKIDKMTYWITDGGSKKVGETPSKGFEYIFTRCLN